MPTAQSREVFKENCPFLKRDVILKRDTWHGKILRDHPEMDGKINLVKETVKKCSASDVFMQPDGRLFIQIKTKYFEPINNQLRIAINIKDATDAEIPSVYPVSSFPKGVKFYEPGK